MGLLRFLLAICVIGGHSSSILGLPLLAAGLAVKTFFIISGFYMTLILTSKYHLEKGGYWLFFSNRLLRIYPSYLAVLAGSILFYVAASIKLHAPADRLAFWLQAWHTHRFWQLILIAISQVTIVGLDFTPLFDFSLAHGFAWTGTLGADASRAWRFNFLPQSWSISVELIFYCFAPFLCTASLPILFGVVVADFGANLAAHYLLPQALAEAATYHFFPFQFGYLVLGILAFRLLHPLFEKGHIRTALSWGILAPFTAIVLGFGWLPHDLAYVTCIVLAFFAVPLLFNLSRRAKLDRFIGDLSYPMYLVHIPCKWVILALMGVPRKDDTVVVPGWELLALSVVASVCLVWLIDYPVDRWRQRRVAARLAPALTK
jgi:peptidoglycan/LPS O-acetylase OafA/YrhL